jgi:peptide/nickel transport system permease protein
MTDANENTGTSPVEEQGPTGRPGAPLEDLLLPGEIGMDVQADFEEVTLRESPRSWKRIVRGLLTNPASLLGTVILLTFGGIAVLAPVLAPCPVDEYPRQRTYCGRDPFKVPKFGHSTQPLPPSKEHPFGTTTQQYDIYYGVIWGTRTAFKVGIVITAAALLIGLTVGSISAYYGGWIDEGLMRIVEVFQAFPFFLAAITLATILRSKPDFQGTLPAVIALIAFGWTGYARLVRADILSVKQREYVWAARSLGAGDFSIIRKHVLPNSIYPVLVVASLDIGTIVLTFAALSFFGIGVPDGYADWGQMISSARNRIPSLAQDWFIVVFPGTAILLFSLSWNLIGDAFRDLLDPRFTGSRA